MKLYSIDLSSYKGFLHKVLEENDRNRLLFKKFKYSRNLFRKKINKLLDMEF